MSACICKRPWPYDGRCPWCSPLGDDDDGPRFVPVWPPTTELFREWLMGDFVRLVFLRVLQLRGLQLQAAAAATETLRGMRRRALEGEPRAELLAEANAAIDTLIAAGYVAPDVEPPASS